MFNTPITSIVAHTQGIDLVSARKLDEHVVEMTAEAGRAINSRPGDLVRLHSADSDRPPHRRAKHTILGFHLANVLARSSAFGLALYNCMRSDASAESADIHNVAAASTGLATLSAVGTLAFALHKYCTDINVTPTALKTLTWPKELGAMVGNKVLENYGPMLDALLLSGGFGLALFSMQHAVAAESAASAVQTSAQSPHPTDTPDSPMPPSSHWSTGALVMEGISAILPLFATPVVDAAIANAEYEDTRQQYDMVGSKELPTSDDSSSASSVSLKKMGPLDDAVPHVDIGQRV